MCERGPGQCKASSAWSRTKAVLQAKGPRGDRAPGSGDGTEVRTIWLLDAHANRTICWYVCMCACAYVYLSISCLYLSACLLVCLSVCFDKSLSFAKYFFLEFYLNFYLFQLYFFAVGHHLAQYVNIILTIYRSATLNSNTVNSKYHLIQSFFEIFARFLSLHV